MSFGGAWVHGLGAAVALRPRLGDLGGTDCENLRDGLVAQPVNAASSLAYVVAGIWAATRVRRLPREDRWWAVGYSLLLMLVGVGSVDFHGPQSPIAKPLHDDPIVALIVLGVAIGVRGWIRNRRPLPGMTRGLLVALLVTAGAAPTAFALGRTAARLCDPDSFLQLHGLWHILTAVGFALIFQALFGGRPVAGATQ